MPNRTAKITYSVAALAVAGLLVGVGSAVASVTASPKPATVSVADTTPKPTTAPEASAVFPKSEQERVGGAENCRPLAWIEISNEVDPDGNYIGHRGEIQGEPIDFGPREGANGTVNRDDQGRIVSYTTVADDNWDGIETRLCMASSPIARYNYVGTRPAAPYYEHTWTPGDTVILRPDPSVALPPRA